LLCSVKSTVPIISKVEVFSTLQPSLISRLPIGGPNYINYLLLRRATMAHVRAGVPRKTNGFHRLWVTLPTDITRTAPPRRKSIKFSRMPPVKEMPLSQARRFYSHPTKEGKIFLRSSLPVR